MIFDPLYWIMIIPVAIFAMWAQAAVKGRFQKYSQVRPSSGLSGAQAAARMLRAGGITDVQIERARGFLSDHYDPKHKVIRLSPEVHDGVSLSALGVATHEVGHAYQHANGYAPLHLRNAIVPMAGFGSWLAIPLLFLGIIINSMGLALVGLGLFSLVAIFQVINLPVEFNASSRAKEYLLNSGMVMTGAEQQGVSKVLSAAAMTYVAATATAVVNLLYWALVIFGRRD